MTNDLFLLSANDPKLASNTTECGFNGNYILQNTDKSAMHKQCDFNDCKDQNTIHLECGQEISGYI